MSLKPFVERKTSVFLRSERHQNVNVNYALDSGLKSSFCFAFDDVPKIRFVAHVTQNLVLSVCRLFLRLYLWRMHAACKDCRNVIWPHSRRQLRAVATAERLISQLSTRAGRIPYPDPGLSDLLERACMLGQYISLATSWSTSPSGNTFHMQPLTF